MPNLSVPNRRNSERVQSTKRASLIIGLDRKPKRFPCLILDSSREGFRLRGSFRLKRGQSVEVVLEDGPLLAVRCSVVWVGKSDSKLGGEVGVETL